MSIVSKPNNFIQYPSNGPDPFGATNASNTKKINPYLYSFSGSDTLVSICFEASPENEVKLESVNTISISIHEQKTPVRRLGSAAPVGFTSSMRVIGGSIILTAVNGHPLQALVSADLEATQARAQDGGKTTGGSVLKQRNVKQNFQTDFYLPFNSDEIDRANYLGLSTSLGYFNNSNKGMPLCTVLPPMKIRLLFVSEYRNQIVPGYGEIILNNVNFISENIVMSVNNMVTEFVLQFVASDVKEFQFTETDINDRVTNAPAQTEEPSSSSTSEPQQTNNEEGG